MSMPEHPVGVHVATKIAHDLSAVRAELAKLEILKTADPRAVTMALLQAAIAAAVGRGGAARADFDNVVKAAWERWHETPSPEG